MGRQNKLQKFAELATLPNVYQNADFLNPELKDGSGTVVDMRGKWKNDHFKNQNDLVFELACGRGEYSVGLARLFPNKNFVGVDIKGARIWKGAKIALDDGLYNVAFLRSRIEQLNLFVGTQEIDELWITFPDPFQKSGDNINNRLVAPRFLEQYAKLVKKGGTVHLKTDNDILFEYALEVIPKQGYDLNACERDVYGMESIPEELTIETYYERMHKGKGSTINYLNYTV